MLYVFAFVMLLAGSIILVGYAGRDTRPDRSRRDDA